MFLVSVAWISCSPVKPFPLVSVLSFLSVCPTILKQSCLCNWVSPFRHFTFLTACISSSKPWVGIASQIQMKLINFLPVALFPNWLLPQQQPREPPSGQRQTPALGPEGPDSVVAVSPPQTPNPRSKNRLQKLYKRHYISLIEINTLLFRLLLNKIAFFLFCHNENKLTAEEVSKSMRAVCTSACCSQYLR